MEYVIIGLLALALLFMYTMFTYERNALKEYKLKQSNNTGTNDNLKVEYEIAIREVNKLVDVNKHLLTELELEQEKSRSIASQKKSGEVRLGQIGEQLIPFLKDFKHEPKNLRFIGSPIDFIAFNFDDGSITFIEVKTGNSKHSKRQKIIKNIIKSGRVFFEEIRLDENGVISKITKGEDDVVKKD